MDILKLIEQANSQSPSIALQRSLTDALVQTLDNLERIHCLAAHLLGGKDCVREVELAALEALENSNYSISGRPSEREGLVEVTLSFTSEKGH